MLSSDMQVEVIVEKNIVIDIQYLVQELRLQRRTTRLVTCASVSERLFTCVHFASYFVVLT